MRRILGLLFVSLLGLGGGRSADGADFFSGQPGDPTAAFPLRVSANQRYLVDQNNVPFFIAGDSPQNMFLALSEAEADSFMANRQTVGFNTLWLMVITLYPNAVTYDGIPPFTVLGDL